MPESRHLYAQTKETHAHGRAIDYKTGINNAWSNIANFIPKLVVFLIILIIGFLIAKALTKALSAVPLYRHYEGHLGAASQPRHGADHEVDDDTDAGTDADRAGRDTRPDLTGQPGIKGHDTSGPTTDDAMTRSEDRLHVGTENVQTGRARLRKYIVTENVTTTVPVSREKVRIEREPITEANCGEPMAGGDLTEEEHEVILHAEPPVVDKETVPVERVRPGTETVTEQQEVTEQVRKEQIDQVEGDTSRTG